MIIEFVREDLSAARGLMRSAWGPVENMHETRVQLVEIISGVEDRIHPGVVYQLDNTEISDRAAISFSWVVRAAEDRLEQTPW